MYAGTTLYRTSGRILGAHQKLDRVARQAITAAAPDSLFPSIKEILHFEGKNGPDGIKRKSPARDEPWHYYDPTDTKHQPLLVMIERHSKNLTAALKKQDAEKAAFEAAWLAHAIVDGLTPAHHFPLTAKLEELRGEGIETRTTLREKIIVRSAGDSRRQVLSKNWQYWGAKGIMTTHFLFEIGVATIIAPLRMTNGHPTDEDYDRVLRTGFVSAYREAALEIYNLNMYGRFSKKGWTRTLARQTRQVLAPKIAKMIALSWYAALKQAESTD